MSGVVFQSTIKSDGKGGWCIELLDTLDGRMAVCNNLAEYEVMIQHLGEQYGGHIDQVNWTQEEGISPVLVDQVRVAMMEYQEKYKDQIEDK